VVAAPTNGFAHGALFYSGDDEYLRTTTPFIRDGLEAEEPVLVVVDADKITLLRDALGADARAVTFEDMHEVGNNPARIIARWRDFVDGHSLAAGAVRGIGEPVSARRRAVELAECHQHESLINVAFADGVALNLLCPYDVAALESSVVDEARRTHPHVIESGSRVVSESFCRRDAEAWLQAPLAAPPAHAERVEFDEASLRSVRECVSTMARRAGMHGDRIADLVLAVNELATNSVTHGAGAGTLTMWTDDASMICEVFDSGRLDDPLAGRLRPDPLQIGGRGLWLANQLSDLTQLRRTSSGTRIRLHFSVD
jgi:anti-sigma regulatory factor (Ser/Thr protein kinase)